MAYPSTETQSIRQSISALYGSIEHIDALLKRYNALGGVGFFKQYLSDAQNDPTTDIAIDDFVTAMALLETLQEWIDTDFRRDVLVKMRL